MLSTTLQKKKKKGHKAQHAKKTNQPPKGLHTLSLYRGKKRGATKREVCITHYAYHTFLLHVYRTSSIAFLLLFDHDHAARIREPTKVGHTPPTTHGTHTHAHRHRPHRAQPPQAAHTNTKRHTAHTHTPRPRRRAPRAPTTTTSGPQPGVAGNHAHGPRPGVATDQPRHPAADPSQGWRGPTTKPHSQEWQGANHHRTAADPSQEWRGAAPTSLSQEWRGTHTTHQPQPHNHQLQAPTKRGGDTKPQTTDTPHTRNHAHQRTRKTHPPHHHTTPPTTRTPQPTQHTTQHGHRARPHTTQTHTTRDTPTRETPHRNQQAPVRRGGEPHTTTAGGPQPGVAANRTRGPQPGVARNAHHH